MAYQTLSDRLTRLEEERKRVWDNINWTRIGLMAVIVVVLGVGGFLSTSMNARIDEVREIAEENRDAINQLRLEFELESQADAEFRAQVLAWIAEQNARAAER